MASQIGRKAPSGGISRAAGLVVATIGLVALLGWSLGVESLRSVSPGLVSMKANTAACFVLLGLALAVSRAQWPVVPLAGIAIGVGLLTIGEYVAGRNFGIDELLFADPRSLRLGLPPGRMALASAVAFALTGSALIFMGGRRVVPAQYLTFAAILITAVSLLAYVFGEADITRKSPYTSLAINTVLAFSILGAGILRECAGAGPMAVFFEEGAGGLLLRRLLPLMIGSTLLLGFAAFFGARQGRYSFSGGMVGFAVVTSVALIVALWMNASSLSRVDADRRRALEWFRMTLKSVGDAVIATDRAGRVTFLNEVAEDLTGWAAAEALGRPVEEVFLIVNEATRAPVVNPVGRVVATGQVIGLANHTVLIARDGTERPIDDSAAPIRDDREEVAGVVLVFRDVSERKRVEEDLADARRRLDAALSAGSIATWTWDIANDRVVADGSLARFVSASSGEAGGQPLGRYLDAVHPEDREAIARAITRAVESGDGYDEECRLVGADGSIRSIVARGEVQRDPLGRAARLSGVVVDITDRKRAEEDARRGEERYRTLFESIDEGFCVIEILFDSAGAAEDYRFVEMNPAFARQTGLRDAAGRRIRELAPEIEGHWFDVYGRVVETGEPVRFVSEAKSLGGRWFDAYAFRLGDREERRVAILFKDITQARRDQEQRDGLVDRLRQEDRRKDEFLAMLAHELRNPLAAIGNALALATRSGLPEHAEWSAGVVGRQVRHLTRLIDDLLDVSRISRGKIELRRDLVDATPILESALSTVRGLVGERKHSLQVELDRGNLWVVADPTRLEQVVVNLLNNAAKYSENAGQIRLRARNEGAEVVIAVEDEGIGIPPERVPEMFELFAQGDRSLARSEGGLGIGLTVVKNLVEMHGGTIAAESEGPGKGSEFTIRLPAASRPAAGDADAATDGASRDTSTGPSRILVVDDNEDTARGMARLLKLLGHEVVTAHGGPEAIEAAREHRPGVILLDIGLPGMNGYEVAIALRREPSTREALIVAVSGYGQDEDRRRSQEAGFDHHFLKPLDHDALLALLSNRTARR